MRAMKSWFLLAIIGFTSSCAIPQMSSPTVISTDIPNPLPTLTPSSSSLPEPTPIITEPTDDQFSEEVLLWAADASASSSRSDSAYDADQAVGAPNTFACGDFVTAWQPSNDTDQAWIELSFFPYIMPNQIQIVHTYLPGQVSRIEVLTLDDEILTVFDASESYYLEIPDCTITRVVTTETIEVLIRAVRVSLVRSQDEPWTQIDAVGVLGLVGDELPVFDPTPIPADEETEFGDPLYISNKNQISSLAFSPGQLWAAGPGGVTGWDLDTLQYTAYTHAEGLPANASTSIAYCDWDGGIVAVGGFKGVSLLHLEWDGYFESLAHPGDADYGSVTALGCDNAREQLWIGYTSRISRYDFSTQNWDEYSWENGLPDGTVRQFSFLDDDVWVAMSSGLAIFEDGKQLQAFTPESSQIPAMFIHAIASDEGGTIWMASSEGLWASTDTGWALFSMQDFGADRMQDVLMGMAAAVDGTFWIGDHFGTLCQFEPSSRECLQTFSTTDKDTLTALLVDDQNRVAVGTHEDGIYLLSDEEWFHLLTNDHVLENQFQAIAYTPDGRIWLAGSSALQYFQASNPAAAWSTVKLPDGGIPFSLLAANDGLWVGHTHGALFLPYIGEATISLKVGDQTSAVAGTVTAIQKDNAGRMYFGTEKGLTIWNESRFLYFDLMSMAQRDVLSYPPKVHCIINDGEAIWVGARTGLHKFSEGELVESWTEELQLISSFYETSVGAISAEPLGDGLLVAIGQELFRFDGKSFETVLTLPSEIRSLYRTPYALWVATSSSGIWSLPIDSTAVYWEAASASSNFASRFGYQSIVMSDFYSLWFASLEGGIERRTGMFGQ